MAKGGVREGAGRKPGIPNKRTRVDQEKAAAGGIMPLEYMLERLRDKTLDFESRDKMAIAAAPYLHAKLSSVEMRAEVTTLGDILDASE